MHENSLVDVTGKWVIAAVTRDYCDIWHVSDTHEREVMHLRRPDEGVEHHHVRQAQEHHGHRSDQGSAEYYKLVTEVRHVNLPALSGGELIQMAHEWKKEQWEFGV
jgi:hypothetical protein